MSTIPLNVLVLEDVPNDAELEIAELEQAGYTCRWKRVETREAFLAELEASGCDIVLSDFALPSFDGLSALKLLLERKKDIPFILVSGTLGEDAAIESLKAGATDYVLKDRLSRLGPVVRRALQEQADRQESRRAAEALRENEEQLRMIFEAVDNIAFITTDLAGTNTRILSFSAGAQNIFGYKPQEIIGQKMAVLHPTDVEKTIPEMQEALRQGRKGFDNETMMVRKSGELFPAMFTLHPRFDPAGELIGSVGVTLDITERKKAETLLKKHNRELEQFNKMTMGRELRMIELKKEINALCRELGRKEPYA
ncbi:PAS domain S-box protein [Pontiella sp.]|uniref:PAS domain-containing response regulator n=1 Tax=Pontiella sp. TaxID=2837462 RepID=UPI00356ADFC4